MHDNLASFEQTLSNGSVNIGFNSIIDDLGLFDQLKNFLSPSFQVSNEVLVPDFSINFQRYDKAAEAILSKEVDRQCTIRTSSADMFNLQGDVIVDEFGKTIVHDRAKKTAFSIEQGSTEITAYVSGSSFIHLVELTRYTSLLFEEARGTILLHASAAAIDDEAVLVLGNKGAGKTTTLLQLIFGSGLDYLSGDKVLLSADEDGLFVRSWPDYPHVGIGTLKGYPEFAAACGVDFQDGSGKSKTDGHKELIDPHLFRTALAGRRQRSCRKVRALLFPQIIHDSTSVREIPESERHLDSLEENVEFAHEFTPGKWHGICADIERKERQLDSNLLEQLRMVPWYSVLGPVSNPLGGTER